MQIVDAGKTSKNKLASYLRESFHIKQNHLVIRLVFPVEFSLPSKKGPQLRAFFSLYFLPIFYAITDFHRTPTLGADLNFAITGGPCYIAAVAEPSACSLEAPTLRPGPLDTPHCILPRGLDRVDR